MLVERGEGEYYPHVDEGGEQVGEVAPLALEYVSGCHVVGSVLVKESAGMTLGEPASRLGELLNLGVTRGEDAVVIFFNTPYLLTTTTTTILCTIIYEINTIHYVACDKHTIHYIAYDTYYTLHSM